MTDGIHLTDGRRSGDPDGGGTGNGADDLPAASRVPVADAEGLRRLRADLAGYTVDALDEVLTPTVRAALGREQVVPAARWASSVLDGTAPGTGLRAGSPREGAPPGDVVPEGVVPEGVVPDVRPGESAAAALVTLFLLSRSLPRRQVEHALPRLGVDGAQRLGLLRAAGHGPDDEVCPRVDLRPYAAVDAQGGAHWWIVSDLPARAGGGPLPVDHVLGVGGASLMLASSTIRRPVGRVLDLGTGCGVQSLHAARHARSVTATDISPRALHFARFTWDLNAGDPTTGGFTTGDPTTGGFTTGGLTTRGSRADAARTTWDAGRAGIPATHITPGGAGLRLLHGSLLEPVVGESFDLVVSNPPFVITPRGGGVPRYDYRDGGAVGDELVRHLVTHLGTVLAPGGVAQMLGNWEHRRGEPWQERVAGWLEESGLEGWVVQREVQDAAEYAETWIRDGGQAAGARFDALYSAWLDDFEARRVDGVGFGLITLRRPAGGGRGSWRRVEEVRTPLPGPLGGHLEACLAAQEWLRTSAATDDALADAPLRVAPDVTEERHHLPGEEDPQIILLRQGSGFGRTVRASAALAGLVGACDGELTSGRLIAALAGLLEVPAADLAGELLPAIRDLIADGMLLPPVA